MVKANLEFLIFNLLNVVKNECQKQPGTENSKRDEILNFGEPSPEFLKRHTDFSRMIFNGPYSCEIRLDSVKIGRKNKKNVVSTRFK